jgi:hypothetical protein
VLSSQATRSAGQSQGTGGCYGRATMQDWHQGPWPRADDFVSALDRWAASQRTASAAASRARERSLREQAATLATWTGILVDLAEQGAPVTAVVANQHRRGRIVGVGRDFFVLDAHPGRTALVRADAVASLWPEGAGAPLPAGSRGGAIDLTLLMALALLAEQRSPVCLATTAGLETAGDLLAAGEDILTLRTDSSRRRLAYVPLQAVAWCELR